MEQRDLLPGHPNDRNVKPLQARLARRTGFEGELHNAIDVVDPISRLLSVRVNVCKPPDAAAWSVLEKCASVVK